jgi:antagonist of KipI
MSEMRVIKPGLLTTVQDLGRWGFQSRGVPVAGPMDAYAHRLANALAGNHAGAATLEITLVGPELEFDDDRVVAVTGARFELTVADHQMPMPMQTAVAVSRGSRLKFGKRLSGARAYLAVAGGIAAAPVLGSRATHVTTAMGGIDGRALRAGDRVPIGPAQGPPDYLRQGLRRYAEASAKAEGGHNVQTAAGELPGNRGVRLQADHPTSPARLHVLPGPHSDYFSDEALRVLQAAPYTIDQQSDRMAFRLDGDAIPHARADLISDATPMGAVQILPSGLPILLMADRQTTGGYPQLAIVMTADLHIAGQLAPGDTVSFAACSAGDAMTALIAQERTLMNIEGRESA